MKTQITRLTFGLSILSLMSSAALASELNADLLSKTDPAEFASDDKVLSGSAFIPLEAFDDFEGWVEVSRFDQGAIFDTSPIRFSESFGMLPESIPTINELLQTPSEFNPGVTRLTVPPNTESFTLKTDTVNALGGASFPYLTEFAPQIISFGSFFESLPSTSNDFVEVTADTLYMVKWDISTPFLAEQSTQLPLVQLVVGDTGAYGLGRSLISMEQYNHNNLTGENLTFRQYFYAHEAGEIGFFVTLYDHATAGTTAAGEGFPDGHIGHEVTINRVDVFEVSEASLTGEEVVFNQGQEMVPLVAGEPTPRGANRTGGFDLDLWTGNDYFAGIGANAQRNASFSPDNPLIRPGSQMVSTNATSDTLSFSLDTGVGPVYLIWDTVNSLAFDLQSDDPNKKNIQEVLTLEEGTLVFMDYWLSATGPLDDLPFTRVGMASAQIGPDGENLGAVQGYAAFHEFTPRSKVFERSNGLDAVPSTGLQDGRARRARLVWEVQFASNPDRTGGAYAFRPTIESFVIPSVSGSNESKANGTINIHRVVVTTFDPPAGIDTAAVPPEITDL